MATLVLSAVGTLVGGPIGGAIGALAGRAVDAQLLPSASREGPRLKELAVSTSSYGQPLPRQFGTVRAAGTIIWATDLKESEEEAGGGKGQPDVTTYSYSVSLAVALASNPIAGIGRIWADGNLLRGEAGDLKTGGQIRIHTGHGDQGVDPLIAADKGAECPAFRNCAYVVFEDLALADFGNRVPALTFEVFGEQAALGLADLAAPDQTRIAATDPLDGLDGYAIEGGPIRQVLANLDRVYPLACDSADRRVARLADGAAPLLPEGAIAVDEGEFGTRDGKATDRATGSGTKPTALRYYDRERDFQPGLQRPAGHVPDGRTQTIDFPGTMAALTARRLVAGAAIRSEAGRETIRWRTPELDPDIRPGGLVRVPGRAGTWRVTGWEWRETGVELALARNAPQTAAPAAADTGRPSLPGDHLPGPTRLDYFELPLAAPLAGQRTRRYAAASSPAAGWRGAQLYREVGGRLEPLGATGRRRSVVGTTLGILPPSPALIIERDAALEVELAASDLALSPATHEALANGANRALVGEEILQFANAEQIGDATWRLTGLLRGRGGTEGAASEPLQAGARFVLIDASLVPLDEDSAERIAAIGLADPEPVYARIATSGLAAQPLPPVRGSATVAADGARTLRWTRRARGAWNWRDGVEAPVVEQVERYLVGVGPVSAPHASWTTFAPELTLSGETWSALATAHPGAPVWVRQSGDLALSRPSPITTL